VWIAVSVDLQFAFQNKNEALSVNRAEFAAGLKLSSVLGEIRADRRTCVHNRSAGRHTWQGCANEGIGCQKKMVMLA
jgi:hypothetical protein